MNLTLQTAVIAASLFAAFLFKAGSANPTSNVDARKASEAWAASISAEQSGDYAEALKKTALWNQAGGDLYLSLVRKAWLNFQSRDFAKAATSYAQASSQQPTALTPLLGLLATAQAMNDPAKVLAASERILRIEPTNYKALMAVANAQFVAGDYRRSRSAYNRVRGIYPEDNDALSGSAWSALYVGDRHDAQRIFERIATVSPAYPYVQEGLAICQR
jgi:tetratricopeptide (TPR) repeat protein